MPNDDALGRGDASRLDILKAAARLLRNQGYAETSLRSVADQVNMKAGSLYYHFSSKDELVFEVFLIGVQRVAEAVRKALTDLPTGAAPSDRLKTAIRTHSHTLLVENDFTSAHVRCFPYAPAAVRDRIKPYRHAYEDLWLGIIGDCYPDAESTENRYLCYALIGALNSALEWFDPKKYSLDDYLSTVESRVVPV
jgi:AcrR family transcriptional regulator